MYVKNRIDLFIVWTILLEIIMATPEQAVKLNVKASMEMSNL